MAKTIETRGIFAPNPSRQDSKASTTSNVARAILETEAKQREAEDRPAARIAAEEGGRGRAVRRPRPAKPAAKKRHGRKFPAKKATAEGLTGRSALVAA